jgi:uncharacterized protein YjiS (DUF1127 family)
MPIQKENAMSRIDTSQRQFDTSVVTLVPMLPPKETRNLLVVLPKNPEVGLFAKLWRTWQIWTNARHLEQSISRLQELSPHLLDDAGLAPVADVTKSPGVGIVLVQSK